MFTVHVAVDEEKNIGAEKLVIFAHLPVLLSVAGVIIHSMLSTS